MPLQLVVQNQEVIDNSIQQSEIGKSVPLTTITQHNVTTSIPVSEVLQSLHKKNKTISKTKKKLTLPKKNLRKN